MFMPASSSIDDSRATMAPARDSVWLPMAIVVVVTTSIAMGMDTTSSTTVKEIASANVVFSMLIRKPSTVQQRMMEMEMRNTMMRNSTFRSQERKRKRSRKRKRKRSAGLPPPQSARSALTPPAHAARTQAAAAAGARAPSQNGWPRPRTG